MRQGWRLLPDEPGQEHDGPDRERRDGAADLQGTDLDHLRIDFSFEVGAHVADLLAQLDLTSADLDTQPRFASAHLFARSGVALTGLLAQIAIDGAQCLPQFQLELAETGIEIVLVTSS